jgi:MurNAc alpha-1-phosphate uridylyltransferase
MTLPCVILAGGLGTRMASHLTAIPKALVPVRGRPFADIQLERLAAAGIDEVVYCIGHRGALLRDHVGDGAQLGLRVEYVDEGEDLRGTAGALRLAAERGLLPDEFHVLYGDSFLTVDFDAVELAWRGREEHAQMLVLRNEGRWDRSNVVVKDALVQVYEPDGARSHDGMHWIDYGLSTLNRDVVENSIPPGRVVQLSSVWAALSARRELAAYEVHERFYEVGSPAGLRDLEEHLGPRA